MREFATPVLLFTILAWVILSGLGSMAKAGEGNCGKKYHVDYLLYLDLFCEITAEEE